MNQGWVNFYRERVNNDRSLERFETKYRPFIDAILGLRPRHCVEFGCGIGSITKLLMRQDPHRHHTLVDISVPMLRLTSTNLGEGNYTLYRHDITRPFHQTGFDVAHSHGVLEHFRDEDIRSIISHQRRIAERLIHCVPTDKYDAPSYGDERLLSAERWREICRPDCIIPINDGFEIVMLWERSPCPNTSSIARRAQNDFHISTAPAVSARQVA